MQPEKAFSNAMLGHHGLGAVGEFVRERFRDGCPEIIARLIHDAPGQIQRTITGLPFKLPDWLVTFCLSGPRLSIFDSRLVMFHALNFISRRGTKTVQQTMLRTCQSVSHFQDKAISSFNLNLATFHKVTKKFIDAVFVGKLLAINYEVSVFDLKRHGKIAPDYRDVFDIVRQFRCECFVPPGNDFDSIVLEQQNFSHRKHPANESGDEYPGQDAENASHANQKHPFKPRHSLSGKRRIQANAGTRHINRKQHADQDSGDYGH